MTDSTFFCLTDGARNVAIAGWPVEGGWWAIAVDATSASGVSLGWPYRLFSSVVWREGECTPLAAMLEERASGDETPRDVCGSLLDVSREECLRRRCFFRAAPGGTGNAARDQRLPRDERRGTFVAGSH